MGYTIGNLTKYRNVALDLVPGRTEQAREISAPQDWYRTYVEGGTMQKRLGVAVAKASQNPRIKGFKGFSAKQSFTGPLRLVNQ